ncbi:MAG: cysteine--tRNA ligase, partial [Candidatus Peregrinibacteria bacterium]|nr:cysteine--tRNA ligase [Candidatus Peregrinibacteria bacterium]
MLHVYNTLTNQKEGFKPIQEGKVDMYLCGPTVYDNGHLGHGRSAVAFDIIRRYLEYVYREENVTFVTNYTDIDDKMINRANEEGITVKELADRIIPEYEKDYGSLGVKPPTIQTLATEYVDQMIEIVEKLIKEEYAYELEDGVYFEVEKFKEYGKLSNQKREELQAGSRIDKNDNKRHPHDFVLWKKEKPGEPSWDSPWGKGRPGWHIECSAMSYSNLGQPFDIHGGGQDLTFPHHECEIAQSEAAYGVQFCNVWLHNGFITVDKEKMSKSLGNFFTLKDIFKKYDPRAVRYFFLTSHYRSPIEFSDQQLEQAKNTLDRIRDFLLNLSHYKGNPNTPHEE